MRRLSPKFVIQYASPKSGRETRGCRMYYRKVVDLSHDMSITLAKTMIDDYTNSK